MTTMPSCPTFSEESLEAVSQPKLNCTRRNPRIHVILLSQRFNSEISEEEPVDRNPEISAVEQIEELAANLQPMVLAESEALIDRQIDHSHSLGAEGVARRRAGVGPGGVQEADSVTGVSVAVDVAAEEDRIRLRGLEGAGVGELPSAEYVLTNVARQIPDQAVSEPVSHIEVRVRAFGAAVEAVLRQGRRARQVEQVRDLVDRVRPGVSGRELNAVREPLVQLNLQAVVIRVGVGFDRGERAEQRKRPKAT